MEEQSLLQSVRHYLRKPAVALVILGALTFVAYSGALSFEFVWDDFVQIVDNPLIRSWHSLPSIFQSDLWFSSSQYQVYYRPFFIVWETLIYSICALNSWAWHLITVLLHVGASLSVYFLVRKLRVEHWTALLAALLFALHPVHVEVAAWISAGADSMVTILYIGALIAFIDSYEAVHRRWLWRIASFVFAACASLTKEMGVTLCVIVAIYVWFAADAGSSRVRRGWKSAQAALPYGLIALGYLALRQFALNHPVKIDDSHTFGDMIATLPAVLVTYLRYLVFPSGLNAFYNTPYVETLGWTNFYFPLMVLAAVIGVLVFWTLKKGDKIVGFAALWMIVTLIPVLYLRALSPGDFVRDRYVYLPSVGFAILAAKAIMLLSSLKFKIASAGLQAAVAVVLFVAYLTGCVMQQTYWANELVVSYRGYQLSPDSNYGATTLAVALMKRQDFGRALSIIEERIAKYPGTKSSNQLFYPLAMIYLESGRLEEGRSTLKKALTTDPDYVQSDEGAATLVGALARAKDYDGALEVCSRSLAKPKDRFAILFNCAMTNYESGRDADAERLLRRVEQVAPGRSSSKHLLGRVLLRERRLAEAEAYLRAAIAIEPSGPEFHYWLGQALEAEGQLAAARQEYATELTYNPHYRPAIERVSGLQKKN